MKNLTCVLGLLSLALTLSLAGWPTFLRGWPTFTLFVKVGTARSDVTAFLPRPPVGCLCVQSSAALLRHR